MVICVSWPIPYKNPQRKLFFNTGFQFNYAEPFSLSSFYNATYYQNILGGRHNLDDNFLSSDFSTKSNEHKAIDVNATQHTDGMQNKRLVERSIGSEQNDLIGSDLTAAQLYHSIEENIKEWACYQIRLNTSID